jgi:hypothetical protein
MINFPVGYAVPQEQWPKMRKLAALAAEIEKHQAARIKRVPAVQFCQFEVLNGRARCKVCGAEFEWAGQPIYARCGIKRKSNLTLHMSLPSSGAVALIARARTFDDLPCAHRGLARGAVAQRSKGGKLKRVQVRDCALFTVCSLLPTGATYQGASVHACLHCVQRKAAESGVQESRDTV